MGLNQFSVCILCLTTFVAAWWLGQEYSHIEFRVLQEDTPTSVVGGPASSKELIYTSAPIAELKKEKRDDTKIIDNVADRINSMESISSSGFTDSREEEETSNFNHSKAVPAASSTELIDSNKPSTPPSTTEETASCSTADRRMLARNLPLTTPEQWKKLTFCLVHKQMHQKMGMFFMHVSKSGGTSVGGLLRRKHCLDDPISHKARGLRTDKWLGFNPNWYRRETGLPAWGFLNKNVVHGLSCEEMESYMNTTNRITIESEGVVPFQNPQDIYSGGCPNTLSAMILREPMARVESHYKHLHRIDRDLVNRSTLDNGMINAQYMRDTFDIISDNYYTRSLVGHGFYEWQPNDQTASLNQHPLAWTTIIKAANQSLHSMDWIMLMNSKQSDEAFRRDEIFRYGLGLGLETTLGRQRSAKKDEELHLSKYRYLKKLNSLDYKLWEIAQELNRLDNISIEQMKPFYEQAVAASKRTNPSTSMNREQFCCGLVCRDVKTEGMQ